MTPREFAHKAIRVPFLDRGRSYAGWDCWGLVLAAYCDVLGVTLESLMGQYENTYDGKAIEPLVTEAKTHWQKAAVPRLFDVALFTIAGRPVHVGLWLDKQSFLHAEQEIGTVVERFVSPMWSKRLEGIYRHVG